MLLTASLVYTTLARWLSIPATQLAPNSLTGENISLSDGCARSCEKLTMEFGAAVHPGGNDPSFSIWDAKQQEVIPACRVEPTSTADVSRVLKILVDNWCRFAVKGGGHSTNLDASNSIGGVTIDLNQMDHVELLENNTRVNLGPGLVLYEAYSALEEFGLTAVGGRVADVGLPGYTLGGGISNLSPQYGLAVDNVFEYELVLPNATIVNVSETSHPDLYFALRGGGNNFGIVTNFQVRAIPQTQIMAGDRSYHDDYLDVLIEKSYELSTTLANDTYMCFSNRYLWDTTEQRYRMTFGQFYYEPILKPAVFDSLNEVPFESDTVSIGDMSNFTLGAVAPTGLRRAYATITHRPSEELQKEIYGIYREEIEDVKSLPGFTSSVVIQALHTNTINEMKSRGGNALGVESDGPLSIVLLTLGWQNDADDSAMYAYVDKWIERVTEAANQKGLLHPWMYINYANYNQDPFSGYGRENKLRLQEVQKMIDPKGIFTSQGLCRGSFKVL